MVARKTTAVAQPAIILVHGFRGAPAGLEETAKELRRLLPEREILVPAMPPTDSAGELSEYTADAFADFLADFVRKKELKKPILVGHSMGSLIVTATQAKFPELFDARLILLAPVSATTPRPIAALQPLVAVLPNRLVSFATTKYMFVYHGQDAADRKRVFQHALKLTIACGSHYANRKALATAAKFPAQVALPDLKPAKNAQISLIAGAKDKLFSQKSTRKLAKKWHAELEIVPDAGHLVNYERPRALALAIFKRIASS